MAVVVYKCDVCKREIELPRNIEGLEKIDRCTITLGCRGELYHKRVLQDALRPRLPDDVDGLTNWVQRKVLHNHEQPVERIEWTITHNMGVAPVVSVFVDRPTEEDPDNREEITPTDIVFVDKNNITLRFNEPRSGIAQLIGRQSDPNILQPSARLTPVTEVTSTQISANGEVTIATRRSADNGNSIIAINVEFKSGLEPITTVTYIVDDQPSLNSPWSDLNQVVIRGKLYTIRSFPILVPEILTGEITNGATLKFSGVDWNGSTAPLSFESFNSGEALILLASEPYDIVDKIRDQFIDVTVTDTIETQFDLSYSSGEFFADPTVIQRVYPPIRSF